MAISIKALIEAAVDDILLPKRLALLVIPIHSDPSTISLSPSVATAAPTIAPSTRSISKKAALRKTSILPKTSRPTTPKFSRKQSSFKSSKSRRSTAFPLAKWSKRWAARRQRTTTTTTDNYKPVSAEKPPCPLAQKLQAGFTACPVQRGCRRVVGSCRREQL